MQFISLNSVLLVIILSLAIKLVLSCLTKALLKQAASEAGIEQFSPSGNLSDYANHIGKRISRGQLPYS